MDTGLDILFLQFFQISILTLATFSLAMIFVLLFKPDFFSRIAKAANITISSVPLLNQLEAKRDTEKSSTPHLRKLGILIVFISVLSLRILVNYREFFNMSNYITTGRASEWMVSILVQSGAWFFFIFLSFSILSGLIMLISPDKFPAISDFFNQWISTQKFCTRLDLFNNFDSFFMRYRWPIGIFSFITLLYVIYSCFIKLL